MNLMVAEGLITGKIVNLNEKCSNLFKSLDKPIFSFFRKAYIAYLCILLEMDQLKFI
jgi:hypothetical protein